MLRTTLAALVVLLTACAAPAPPKPPREPVRVTTTAPRCSEPTQCKRMWIAAQDAIQTASGMRLRLVTEDRLETFAAMRIGTLTGTVINFPMGGGVYEARARFECPRYVECSDQKVSAENLFNTLVAGLSQPTR